MESIKVIGLMTGTSCDGMDLSLVNCKKNNNSIDGEIIINHYVQYPVSLTKKLLNLYTSAPSELTKTHMELGQFWSEKITEWVKENNLKYDLIGIHGQTIFHDGGQSTLQIGEPLYISKSLKVPVIYNFRTKDIINKGQGAPLMPVVDKWLFKNESKDIITLNIGGISNITIINKNKNILGFDTGPGMSLLDIYCLKYLNLSYDNNGSISSKGKINKTIVQEWIEENNFILSKPPKSTGKELYGEKWLNSHFKSPKRNDHKNNLANLSYFTAKSIALNIQKFHKGKSKKQTPVYISGGGIKNKSITLNLKKLLLNYNVLSIANIGINPLFKESYAFALLAASNYFNIKINTKNITGADKPYIIGEISKWR
tara:strand:- start:1242 stop:2351 length:1110 start_codon:yes stop_codon:yes gene_type:complete